MKFDKSELVLVSHFLPSKNILWICGSLFIVFSISLYVFLTPRISQEQIKKVAECENLWHGTPVMDKTNTVMVECDHSSYDRVQEEFRQAVLRKNKKGQVQVFMTDWQLQVRKKDTDLGVILK